MLEIDNTVIENRLLLRLDLVYDKSIEVELKELFNYRKHKGYFLFTIIFKNYFVYTDILWSDRKV